MSYLFDALEKKRNELRKIIELTSNNSLNVPDGNLRVSHSGTTPQYYYRTKDNDGKNKTGKYIKSKDRKLVYKLAQRDYDREILKVASHRLSTIEPILAEYRASELQEVYSKSNKYRQEFIQPWVMIDEIYVEKWKAYKYQGKDFAEDAAKLYTENGEQVRSKSEKIIADMLRISGIPYRYECPLHLGGLGTVYPDFTVLDAKERKEIFWEHFGMMDNNEYCEKALCKINAYIENDIIPGDRLIITHETNRHPMDTHIIKKIIKNILS